MEIKDNTDITNLTTLRLPGKVAQMAIIRNLAELEELYTKGNLKEKVFVLGGGSNTLWSGVWQGLMLKSEIMGREIVEENEETVLLKLGGGENWHEIVTWVVENNWGGIENLALIPGTVGSAPVQNIGAYGQSLVDSLGKLDFFEFDTGKIRVLNNKECQFGYRDSIFKHELQDRGMIMNVYLQLSKVHKLATDYFSMWTKYESIEAELSKIASLPYSIADVYQAVVNIRTRQLPDWRTVPTAGSFFKNPIVSMEKLSELQAKIPELQVYPADQLSYIQMNDPKFDQAEYVKVPAGRLLDYLGWKGKQIGNCSTYPTHALIVTHNGKATGKEMLEYVKAMQTDVKENLGIELELEVVVR